jgi:uncharacterized protein
MATNTPENATALIGPPDSPESPAASGPTAWSIDGRSFALRARAEDGWRPGDYLTISMAAGEAQLGLLESIEVGQTELVSGSGSLLSSSGGLDEPFPPSAVGRSSAADVSAWFAEMGATLTVGTLATAPAAPWSLIPRKLNRHTFWCGQSGSGKTYALGVALEQILVHTGLPILILDPNSDFVRLNDPNSRSDPAEADAIRARDIRVLRPGTGPGSLRIRFRTMAGPAKAAVLRLDPVVDRAEYNAMVHLSPDSVPHDPVGLVEYLRSTQDPGFTALAERMENLGIVTWQIFAGDLAAATDVVAERPDATVIDLGGLNDQEQQLAVSLAVLDDLWQHRAERRPVLIVIDEAHNLCSPDLESVAGRAVRDRVIQIAAEGRKYGLWLLLSTQRPGKVHRGIVSQCDNLTLMRMNSPNDLVELSDVFGFVPPAMLNQASRFRQGEALLAGGFVPTPGIIRVRDRITTEGGIDVSVPTRD